MSLIIVESPTKAKTITKFLNGKHVVLSSFGHIRDLPKKELGVDIDNDFKPTYIISPKARPKLNILKEYALKEKEVILATDEDREGEAIAFHIANALKLNNPKRIVFHEITKNAIDKAMDNPREIDMNLVNAQQARRILDRLVGYKLSPLLWKKILRGISAGRVQSVALRLIVELENKRNKFISQEFWEIFAELKIKKYAANSYEKQESKNEKLKARLIKIGDKKLDKMDIKTENEAREIVAILEKSVYEIKSIEKKEQKKHPLPPFITDTLQRSAYNLLGMSPKRAMMVAQKLYETGNITYMRTDSPNLSKQALDEAANFIKKEYSEKYLNTTQYKAKGKDAQEAHEAIRPTSFANRGEILDKDQKKLYDLIYKRALASQMSSAIFDKTKIEIQANSDYNNYLFRVNGSQIKFDGFLRVYPVKLEETILPSVSKKEKLDLDKILPEQHFTEPPARFNDASLIKKLKELGIGRPSTYVPTLDTIINRRYVERDESKRLVPTKLGEAVNLLLTKHFANIVDYDFTAKMEKDLDKIAQGKEKWVKIISEFYMPFEKNLKEKTNSLKKEEFLKPELISNRKCPECKSDIVKKMGRFGYFISCSNFPQCKWGEPILDKVGIKCPDCGEKKEGDVIRRKTKRNRIFFGCSKYPKCKWASWDDPTKEKQKITNRI